MAKVEMTEREKKWERVWKEYHKTLEDPDNAGASNARVMAAVSNKLRIPLSTVRDIISRKEAEDGKA